MENRKNTEVLQEHVRWIIEGQDLYRTILDLLKSGKMSIGTTGETNETWIKWYQYKIESADKDIEYVQKMMQADPEFKD
jgi:hypothetical protein